MDRIAVDVTAVNEAKGLWTVAADTAQRSITISYTGVDSQFAQVVVRGSAEYFTHYPHGSLSFLLQDDFFVIQASTSMTVPQLCMHVHGIITAPRREDGMGAPRATMESDDSAGSPSWSMEPTMEYAADDTKTGVNNSLLEDIAVLGEMVTVADMPPIGKLVATVWVPLKTLLTKTELEAYALDTNAPIGIRLTFDRQHYKVAPIQVAVGNASHFKQGQYPPTCVQLSSILASFVSQFVIVSRVSASSLSPLQSLLDLGFEEAQATKALRMAGDDLRTACAILMSDTVDEFNAASAEAKDQKAVKTAYKGVKTPAEIKAFPTEKNLFTACAVYLQQRITSLATFCVICDRTHVFAGSSMMMPTVCSRELCVFRFRKLDVARDAATSVAVQTGVVDLLFNIARAAAKSDRWKNIFQPFPSVPSPDKNPGLDPRNPDAALAARILDKIPSLQVISGVDSTAQLQALLTKAHPLAQGLFDWIVSSNKSHIVKLPAQEHLTFMGTRHQYLFVSSTPERHAAFNELKKKHGSLWAFHGSRAENWHSILRNGLKNASGTALQVNGAAYGSGIYLSPNASTSFGYSQLNSGTTEAQRDAHLKADFIDYDSMRCIAICEVVQHELRQSGSIWVQPHEHCVLTRFLFVYTHSFAEGYNVDLNADVYKRLLSDLCAKYFEM